MKSKRYFRDPLDPLRGMFIGALLGIALWSGAVLGIRFILVVIL